MKEKIKVSVIVPVYNNETTLKRCIYSIIKQNFKNLEIILINDGSNDKSGEICKMFAKENEKIKYFYKKNGGVSSARNLGIEKSNGQYIFFVDCDDSIDIDVINSLVKNVEKNTLLSTKHKIVKNNHEKIVNYKKNLYYKDEYIRGILNSSIKGYSQGFLFNSDIIKNNNIKFDINTSYLEDTLFIVNYLNYCDNVKIIDNRCYYNYFIMPNSTTNKYELNKIIDNINDFFYSLDKIDKLTNNKYSNLILNKKKYLIEKELRNLNKLDDFRVVLNNKKIKDIMKNKKDILGFSFRINSPIMLVLYYKIRRELKKIKNLI